MTTLEGLLDLANEDRKVIAYKKLKTKKNSILQVVKNEQGKKRKLESKDKESQPNKKTKIEEKEEEKKNEVTEQTNPTIKATETQNIVPESTTIPLKKEEEPKKPMIDMSDKRWEKDLPKIEWKERDSAVVRKNYLNNVSNRSNKVIEAFSLNDDKQLSINVPPIEEFNEVLPSELLRYINYMKYTNPTEIQTQSIPLLLSGYDIIALAQTGSGKTLCYALPAICHILDAKESNTDTIALVIVPTRELAQQVAKSVMPFKHLFKIHSSCVFGGERIDIQKKSIENEKPHLIVGTPGRLLDLLASKTISLSNVTYLVLDEADKLVSMGLAAQISRILSQVSPVRLTAMFSATFPPILQKKAMKWLSNPIRIQMGRIVDKDEDLTPINPKIKQDVRVCGDARKIKKLMKTIYQIQKEDANKRNKSAMLIFVNRVKTGEEVLQALQRKNFTVALTHGQIVQHIREKTMQDFKSGKTQVLIATDVASRGLHINNLPYIINYDFPKTLTQYVHRVGRTGRMGSVGNAISFFPFAYSFMAQDLIKILQECQQEIPHLLHLLAKDYKEHPNNFAPKIDYNSDNEIEGEANKKFNIKPPPKNDSNSNTNNSKTNYSKTNYSNTNYKSNYNTNYGKTNYGKSNYGKSNYGKSNYNNTNYGKTNYGKTNYNKTNNSTNSNTNTNNSS